MVFKKLHLGTVSYNDDTFDEIVTNLRNYYANPEYQAKKGKVRKNATIRIAEAVKALSICHNVTPVYESREVQFEATEADQDIGELY